MKIDTPMTTRIDVASLRIRYVLIFAPFGASLRSQSHVRVGNALALLFSCYHRRTGVSSAPGHRRAAVAGIPPGSFLVKVQVFGLSWYWVSDSKFAGGPEMVFFHTTMLSTSGWNRLGCCSVRELASAL